MKTIVQKTLGGLTKTYYFRQLFFGSLFLVLFIWMSMLPHPEGSDPRPGSMLIMILFVINTLLYPYSRFVYERIVGFVLGDNVFFGPAIVMMGMKIITMFLCWGFAIFIAPIGLLYLYFHHTKHEKLHLD